VEVILDGALSCLGVGQRRLACDQRRHVVGTGRYQTKWMAQQRTSGEELCGLLGHHRATGGDGRGWHVSHVSEETAALSSDGRPFRYDARLAHEIEALWQRRWEESGVFHARNPVGALADGQVPPERAYLLDMFPYPSGVGLHVGHPLGFIATDVYARYLRMQGTNVLYTMGFDSFGLPAEQYAIQTGTHPQVTTMRNVGRYRAQLRRLGLSHDDRRTLSTSDPAYYRWTQWIFLQLHDSWYDADRGSARPISELVAAWESGERPIPGGRPWADREPLEREELLSSFRLVYRKQVPVNWCPGLGTVLANEEVTRDGRSERGNFPVVQRNLEQWVMRISAYADRLHDDLDLIDWPESVKLQQRNWIGRSSGARLRFALDGHPGEAIEVFTTRPETVFGSTYVVLAPEHPLVATVATQSWENGTPVAWTGGAASPREACARYAAATSRKSAIERQKEGVLTTGVATGARAVNPATGELVPIFVADYVLPDYGTGAIMAVPAHDQRDFEFARSFGLPVRCVIDPGDGRDTDTSTWSQAHAAPTGVMVNCATAERDFSGMAVAYAATAVVAWLEERAAGEPAVSYRLRDWLFSRQRYWGEPIPIVYDRDGVAHALPESMLPVLLPEVDDYAPRGYDPHDLTSEPETPLSRRRDWVEVELDLDLGDGPQMYTRETNTMPNWAGSCWYELRYIDPGESAAVVEPANEAYWMGPSVQKPAGGVDLYVGGVEQTVLHLLYARFWHKVLHDLGHVSSREPFHRLVNQGMILAWVYRDERGFPVPADEVVQVGDDWAHHGHPVSRSLGKMGKSLRNAVTPDDICAGYGADTLRLYEMSMGPLEVSRPWETRAIVGCYRFLQRLWRNVVDEATGEPAVTDEAAPADLTRLLHRTIAEVGEDMANLKFNTAVARLTTLNNAVSQLDRTPRSVGEPMVLMLAPLAPHLAEELWSRMGHADSLARTPYPVADAALMHEDAVTCVVQVNGKVRGRLHVSRGVSEEELIALAGGLDTVRTLLGDGPARTVVRPPNLVNFVVT
jgi:leucyl-tRNA synthetase